MDDLKTIKIIFLSTQKVVVEWLIQHKCFRSHTIQLYDLHSFPFNVLTYEAEALLFKVTLELRIDLHENNIQSLNKIKSTPTPMSTRCF